MSFVSFTSDKKLEKEEFINYSEKEYCNYQLVLTVYPS